MGQRTSVAMHQNRFLALEGELSLLPDRQARHLRHNCPPGGSKIANLPGPDLQGIGLGRSQHLVDEPRHGGNIRPQVGNGITGHGIKPG